MLFSYNGLEAPLSEFADRIDADDPKDEFDFIEDADGLVELGVVEIGGGVIGFSKSLEDTSAAVSFSLFSRITQCSSKLSSFIGFLWMCLTCDMMAFLNLLTNLHLRQEKLASCNFK